MGICWGWVVCAPSPRPSPAWGEGDVLRVLRVLWRLGVLREMGVMRGGWVMRVGAMVELADWGLCGGVSV